MKTLLTHTLIVACLTLVNINAKATPTESTDLPIVQGPPAPNPAPNNPGSDGKHGHGAPNPPHLNPPCAPPLKPCEPPQ